jgi:hypothetical protein
VTGGGNLFGVGGGKTVVIYTRTTAAMTLLHTGSCQRAAILDFFIILALV